IDDPSIISEGSRAFGSQAVVVAIDARRKTDTGTRGGGDAERGRHGDAGTRGHGVAVSPPLRVSPSPRPPVPPSPRPSWEVYTHGGRVPTGMDAVQWATKAERLGAGEILLTSMDCDGTRDGYDIELTRAIAEAVSIPVIASGGAGRLEHLYD